MRIRAFRGPIGTDSVPGGAPRREIACNRSPLAYVLEFMVVKGAAMTSKGSLIGDRPAHRRDPRLGDSLLVSYLTLRRAVGLIGVTFPVLLSVGCWASGGCTGIEDSISAYYGTDMRNFFVGLLFAIALFMFSYRGYDNRDEIAGKLACVFALGVALFPTTSSNRWIHGAHFCFAAALFLTFSFFSLVLFTESDPKEIRTEQKEKRNAVYKACGIAMLVCIGLIAIFVLFGQDTEVAKIKPVFILETLALWSFGISWGVKGETLLRDRGAVPRSLSVFPLRRGATP